MSYRETWAESYHFTTDSENNNNAKVFTKFIEIISVTTWYSNAIEVRKSCTYRHHNDVFCCGDPFVHPLCDHIGKVSKRIFSDVQIFLLALP